MTTSRERGSVTLIVLISIVAAVTVIVTLSVERTPPTSRSATSPVTYEKVEVWTRPAAVDGTELVVAIDALVNQDQAHVAPYVDVAARCGVDTDEQHAFFMKLDGARAGDRRSDEAVLFPLGLEAPPTRCELRLTLTEGAGPELYCFDGGRTTPGTCP